MRLAHKILIPLLAMLALLAGMSIVLSVRLQHLQTTLIGTGRQFAGMTGQVARLNKLEGAIRVDLLSYRFDRKQSRLDAIAKAEREIAQTIGSYAANVGAGHGRELLHVFASRSNQVLNTRHELIRAIQSGDEQNIRLVFDKLAPQNDWLDAHLKDISTFSETTLEGTMHRIARDQIAFIRGGLYGTALAIVIVLLSYGYLRRNVGGRLAPLAAGIEGIGAGRLDVRIDPRLERAADEIGDLVRAFNTMADQLRASGEALRTEVTERKGAEEKIQRLNRVYAMLSGINGLIVRAHDRDELFHEACRLAVGVGKFQIAWVGLVDRAAMRVLPAAWNGEEGGLLKEIEPRLTLRELPDGESSLVAQAVNEKRPVIINDVEKDPRVVFRAALKERDIGSIAVLPLAVANEPVGVLVLLATAPGFFDEGETRLLVELAGDIAFALDHIEKAERINYLAYYDSLTGLANRSLFHDRLTQFVHTAQRERRRLALSVVDLDRFKNVNDALGRQIGDAMLVQFAQRLTRAAADSSQIARLGADRFALVLPDTEDEADVLRTIENIVTQCVGEAFLLAGTELRIATKIGVALYPNDGGDADTLFRNAEAALKKAKAGAEPVLFYTQQMTERVGERLALESKLRRAREKEEFALYYQPKVDAQTRRVTGVEALIRWLDPQVGMILPAKFIPLLEETGIILDVGAWAIRRAIQDHAYWRTNGIVAPHIAVNVSAVQLHQRDFVDMIRDAVGQETKAAPIALEITESLLMEDIEENISRFKAINGLGVNIAIDDFGTGYSSLGYLARLPVQVLKIDLSFIARMLNDPGTLTLVTTMISLAHSLGLTVVAEGVETEEQATTLQKLGCDELQGYLISPPLPCEQMTELLRSLPRTSPPNGKIRTARTRR